MIWKTLLNIQLNSITFLSLALPKGSGRKLLRKRLGKGAKRQNGSVTSLPRDKSNLALSTYSMSQFTT